MEKMKECDVKKKNGAVHAARDAAGLLRHVRADPSLRRILRVARSHEGVDPGHDLAHSLRVALWTLRLGGAEVDWRDAVAAALLHDVANLPKDSPRRADASVLSARRAAEALRCAGFEENAVVMICQAIEDHSYSRGAAPRTALGRALQDADRLEAVGALGVLRTATCGARLGASYLDLRDPWAARRRPDDGRFTIDHFFVKLLRLEDTLHTEAGRAEARRRTAFMIDFLGELSEEIGVPLARTSLMAGRGPKRRSSGAGGRRPLK